MSDEDKETMKAWSDQYYCRWPDGFNPIDLYRYNQPFITAFDDSDESPIISFSHMVPRRDLLPSRVFLTYKFLPYVMGSTILEEQIRQLHSTIHCYAHAHINNEVMIEGVRYIQNALGYPHERGEKSGVFLPSQHLPIPETISSSASDLIVTPQPSPPPTPPLASSSAPPIDNSSYDPKPLKVERPFTSSSVRIPRLLKIWPVF